MFTYSKYCNDNLPDFKIQFDVFSTLFVNALSSLLVLSDVWPLYKHLLLFTLNWLNFNLKNVKFLFLFSILPGFDSQLLTTLSDLC